MQCQQVKMRWRPQLVLVLSLACAAAASPRTLLQDTAADSPGDYYDYYDYLPQDNQNDDYGVVQDQSGGGPAGKHHRTQCVCICRIAGPLSMTT